MKSGVFRRVLVPVEFGSPKEAELADDRSVEFSDHERVSVNEWTLRALELAARLALGGEVYIAHATPEFMDHASWMSPASVAKLDDGARAYASKVLAAIADRHCVGVTVRHVIRSGRPLDVILGAASEYAVDAIVVAASARHRVHRAVLGSTVDRVIRLSPCPVVVVPSGTS